MTTPISETDALATQPKAESFVDWFHINSRFITIGAVLVCLAVGGAWFVRRMSYNEMVSSDKQLLAAKQSLNSGNAPLAESDLKKVADKYASRPAGAEAGILLAQLRMEKGDYQGALGVLTDLSSKVTSGPAAASVRALLGDAKAQLNKPAEAAADYEKAAGLTTMVNERSFYMAKAGRAYLAAGNTAQARKIFEALAANTDNPAVSTEAKVRLGELVSGGKA